MVSTTETVSDDHLLIPTREEVDHGNDSVAIARVPDHHQGHVATSPRPERVGGTLTSKANGPEGPPHKVETTLSLQEEYR